MPEPTTPTPAVPEITLESIGEYIKRQKAAADSTQALSIAGQTARDMLIGFGNSMSNVSNLLHTQDEMTTKSAAALGVLSTTIFKTNEAFKRFETPNLNTFTRQINDVFTAFDTQGTSLGVVLDKLKHAGLDVPVAFQGSIDMVKAFGLQIAASADNALRLQSGIFSMAAGTGSLNQVYAAAGPNLEHMNDILATHDSLISNTAQAIGVSTANMREYYSELGQVHGALDSTVRAGEKSTEQISMLSATVRYSIGAHRDYKDVMEDLKNAYRNMGIVGEPALRFSARIGEVSNKFGIELDVVKQSLRSATEGLRNYGGEELRTGAIMEGSVRIMNNYTQALKNTGVSGATAVGIIQGMTSQITQLDVAQRAFLSQQSGGPGGLRGAFKVERMIREGNIDQVMEDVRKTMQRQFGRIVSTKEAEESESAASRAIMQRQMLMQGPLGAFAKDEQGAARILEAFSQRAEGKISETDLSSTIVQSTMDQGLKFQESSNTYLGIIARIAEAQQGVAGITNLGLLQHSFTSRSGTTDYETQAPNPELNASRDYLRRTMGAAEQRSAQRAQRMGAMSVSGGQTWATDSGQGNAKRNLKEALNDWDGFMKEVPTFLKGTAQNLMNLYTDGEQTSKELSAELKRIESNVAATRKKAEKTKDEKIKQKLLLEAEELERMINLFNPKKTASTLAPNNAPTRNLQEATTQRLRTPGQAVGAATQQSVNLTATESDKDKSGTPEPPETTGARAANDVTGEVHVHITGYCLACGERIKDSDHTRAVLPIRN